MTADRKTAEAELSKATREHAAAEKKANDAAEKHRQLAAEELRLRRIRDWHAHNPALFDDPAVPQATVAAPPVQQPVVAAPALPQPVTPQNTPPAVAPAPTPPWEQPVPPAPAPEEKPKRKRRTAAEIKAAEQAAADDSGDDDPAEPFAPAADFSTFAVAPPAPQVQLGVDATGAPVYAPAAAPPIF